MKIAVLGATSHIAKGLIENLAKQKEYKLLLYARSIDKVNDFLKRNRVVGVESVETFENFSPTDLDVIINCVGIGRPEKIKEAGYEIFKITEGFDNLATDYLFKNPKCLYINFSSGAVFGKAFQKPVDKNSVASIDVNHLHGDDAYAISKLYTEGKHRALGHLNIVDIRVFAYFSRYIDPQAKFLLSAVVTSIKNEEVLPTTASDIVRDYVHPNDLFQLIDLCIKKVQINDVFDVYSKRPVTKFELFKYFADKYGFTYVIEKDVNKDSSTGAKNVYYSVNHKAQTIGYEPQYTALEAVSDEYSEMVRRNHG